MAITKISKNNVSIMTNIDDDGLFNGLNVITSNTKDIPEQIPENTYLNDIITKDNGAKQIVENQLNFYDKIAQTSTLIGADFQPLEVSARVELDNRKFQVLSTLENFSNNKYVTPLKMFEEKDGKLIDCEIDKIRVKLKDAHETFRDIFNAVLIAKKENKENLNFLPLVEAINKPDSDLYVKSNEGKVIINVTNDNLSEHLDTYTRLFNDNKDILKLNDTTKNNLAKLNNYKVENEVLINLNSIYNNNAPEKIKINSTQIDRYEIIAVEPKNENANAIKLEYSIRPTVMKEKAFDNFKTSYVDENTRKDLDAFIEKAKDDPYTAYHLAKQLKKDFKNDLFTINSLISKARSGEITTDERQKFDNANENVLKVIKKIANENLHSINFNANYYANSFVSDKKPAEQRQVSAFFDLMLKTAKGKINNINNIENIVLTSDNSRIRNNATTSPIFYDGNLPKGSAIVDIEKKAQLKGTMTKDLVADIQMIPTQIVFPAKKFENNKKEEVVVMPKLITPADNSYNSMSRQLFNTLSLISKMNENGEIKNKQGDYFLIDISKRIDKINELAFGKDDITPQLDWKQNQKTKEVYENLIKELNKHKDSPADLVNMVKEIMNGKSSNKVINKNALAVATAIVNNHFDTNDEWSKSVAKNNTRIINECLSNGEFVKKGVLKDNIKTTVNTVVAQIRDYSNAYQKIMSNTPNKEDNILYQMAVQRPKSIFVTPSTISFKNEKGEDNTILAPSFNYKQNNKLDSVSVAVAIENQERKLLVPQLDKIAEALNNSFGNGSSLQADFNKIVTQERTLRGEELKANSFNKVKDEGFDVSSLMQEIDNVSAGLDTIQEVNSSQVEYAEVEAYDFDTLDNVELEQNPEIAYITTDYDSNVEFGDLDNIAFDTPLDDIDLDEDFAESITATIDEEYTAPTQAQKKNLKI